MSRLQDANDDLNLALTQLRSVAHRTPGNEAILELVRVLGNIAVTHAMLYDLLKESLSQTIREPADKRCRAIWREGLLQTHDAPPAGARCRLEHGHAGEHSWPSKAWKGPTP
jgi:hypothetical protein